MPRMVQHVTDDMGKAFSLANEAIRKKEPISIAFHGNIVDLLEYADKQGLSIDLLSDQPRVMRSMKVAIVR